MPILPTAEREFAVSFLDQREVAKRLGLKPRTVGNWAREQKLPAYRFGRLLRFKWDEVEQALAATCRCVPVAAVRAARANEGNNAACQCEPHGPMRAAPALNEPQEI